jgi:hypothetical protein
MGDSERAIGDVIVCALRRARRAACAADVTHAWMQLLSTRAHRVRRRWAMRARVGEANVDGVGEGVITLKT